ncbi:MAG: hypothetical protein PHH47_03970 [Gallionella sp.]|nr:hypothetical protein [Gallionella sp.]MDD4946946.1 hypothetical protein [Gallionella sp.]MDD5611628.1 hypothetical protein [Gallionella sp.]
MELIAFIGSIYALFVLFQAARKYGGFSIPNKVVTLISAGFGIFIGLALEAKSMSIFLSIPAVSEGDWFLGGVITKAILVGVFGTYIIVISWRHAKDS